ncbi:MAG: sensor histidine kinase [Microcystaceae cyanobacterium]
MKLSLGTRLFLSHALVVFAALGSFIITAKISSPRLFVVRLEQLEQRGLLTISFAKSYLLRGFEKAWNGSAAMSVVFGVTTAGVLSYLSSKRIMKPLEGMKKITQDFAAGNLQERMPSSEIPELNQLAHSFNQMAMSLEDVEQHRRDLISDMTHELRTPLTVVRGYLEGLSDGTIESSPDIYLRLIKETRRLERLTYDLQELSKAEAGYLSVSIIPTQLYPLLTSLVERFSDQLLDEGPTLSLDGSSNLPLVMADIDRTEQILVNLMGNAIRYTEKGSIIVKVWTDNSWLWIAVEDTGIGISQDDLPFIFERFWRADKSRTRYTGGTGIGLAIARRLVELQGGTIEVESEVDQGSIFRFCLPLAPATKFYFTSF